jgi:glycerol uptake facilitator protein
MITFGFISGSVLTLPLEGTTGYAINPVRDLGPRVAHAILPIAEKGGSDWSYAPIPVIGPLVGGARRDGCCVSWPSNCVGLFLTKLNF